MKITVATKEELVLSKRFTLLASWSSLSPSRASQISVSAFETRALSHLINYTFPTESTKFHAC